MVSRTAGIPEPSIPAEHAGIIWRGRGAGGVFDVTVFDAREGIPFDDYQGSGGCRYAAWMNLDHWMTFGSMALLTPAGAFGCLIDYGFRSPEDLRLTVEQFARIEECHWARAMMCGIAPVDRRNKPAA